MKNYLSWQTIGLYQGGWQLANSSVGIILMAMGCDLMPRLMKNIHDHTLVGKQINEQMELGMTLGALGVVFTLIFAPALLTLFYSSAFITGSNILRFLVTGVFLRIIGFPLAFVVTAQNRGGLFLLIQLLFFSIEYLLLCWLVISGNSRWLRRQLSAGLYFLRGRTFWQSTIKSSIIAPLDKYWGFFCSRACLSSEPGCWLPAAAMA